MLWVSEMRAVPLPNGRLRKKTAAWPRSRGHESLPPSSRFCFSRSAFGQSEQQELRASCVRGDPALLRDSREGLMLWLSVACGSVGATCPQWAMLSIQLPR